MDEDTFNRGISGEIQRFKDNQKKSGIDYHTRSRIDSNLSKHGVSTSRQMTNCSKGISTSLIESPYFKRNKSLNIPSITPQLKVEELPPTGAKIVLAPSRLIVSHDSVTPYSIKHNTEYSTECNTKCNNSITSEINTLVSDVQSTDQQIDLNFDFSFEGMNESQNLGSNESIEDILDNMITGETLNHIPQTVIDKIELNTILSNINETLENIETLTEESYDFHHTTEEKRIPESQHFVVRDEKSVDEDFVSGIGFDLAFDPSGFMLKSTDRNLFDFISI